MRPITLLDFVGDLLSVQIQHCFFLSIQKLVPLQDTSSAVCGFEGRVVCGNESLLDVVVLIVVVFIVVVNFGFEIDIFANGELAPLE